MTKKSPAWIDFVSVLINWQMEAHISIAIMSAILEKVFTIDFYCLDDPKSYQFDVTGPTI